MDQIATVCDEKDNYRFGFNGQVKDNNLKGIGNSLSYDARFYDSRLGRPLSLDPIANKFPMLSPYQFFSNNPIWFIDLEGKEGIVYTVSMWKNTSGETQMNITTAYDVGGDASGVLYKVHNLDNHSYNTHYIPDVDIIGKRADNRTIDQKFGDWQGT